MDEDELDYFSESFDESRFPEQFLLTYEPMECLSCNEQGETLLVRKRDSDIYYIAKCYNKTESLPKVVESELLMNIRHQGIPEFIERYQNEGMLCVIREYIEGTTLDRLAQEKRFTSEQVITIGKKLCDVLAYLHGCSPPIIHRDIKPQNIILDEEGEVYLIDFGISRLYHEEAYHDTGYYGTIGFAAPEQYGFSQTDGRSDLFSLGVVLYWLLTGETDRMLAASAIENRRLRRLLLKCTSFAPERRIASAELLRASLTRVEGTGRQSMVKKLGLILLCCACLCIGFCIGRYTEIVPFVIEKPGVQFEEPLIEKAVRLTLNKGEDSKILEEELLEVTGIYIFGNRAAANQEEYIALGDQWARKDESIQNGGIHTLQDISRLKNLKVLSIAMQNITEVAPIADLDKLEEIELKHNPIKEVASLKSLLALQRLYIYDTGVSDLSALSACPRLSNLVVGQTNIKSLKAFAGIEKLTYLHAEGITLDTLSGLESFPNLEEISFYSVADGDLSPLLALSKLKKVNISTTMKSVADKLATEAVFEFNFTEK